MAAVTGAKKTAEGKGPVLSMLGAGLTRAKEKVKGLFGKGGGKRAEMAQSAKADRANPPEPAKGVYVYGILPGDIEMTSERAGVTSQLLAPNGEELSYTLDELDSWREYVIRGRYVEQAVLESALSQNEEAARLAEEIRGADPDATRDARIQLGQLISQLITVLRARDTQVAQDAMAGHCVASVIREPAHELDAVHIAYLLDAGQEKHLDQVVKDLAKAWEGQVELEVLGPLLATD